MSGKNPPVPSTGLLPVFLLVLGALATFGLRGAAASSTNAGGRYVTVHGQRLSVHGRRLYFEEYGEGRRPLVLLHGGLSTIRGSFDKQLPAFAKNHHVIAIEQTGHGHSSDADIPFSYRQMADDTVVVLRRLKVRKADIVGWSDGGILALLIASRHPELVHRLVISGANIRLVGLSPAEVKAIRESSPEQLAEGIAPGAYGKVSPDGRDHWPVVVKKVWTMWLTRVVMDKADLAAIKAPVLVVSGDNDIIPLEHTMEIFRSLPKAQLLILPGTGHHTFDEAADMFNPIILDFLDMP